MPLQPYPFPREWSTVSCASSGPDVIFRRLDDWVAAWTKMSFVTRKKVTRMPEKTIFKKIIDGEIPADVVFEDDHCLAFRDANPQAPTHVLVIPKKEIASWSEIAEEDQKLIGHLALVIRQLAVELELAAGYRVVVNNGQDGGQTVDHLHFHLLGGRGMSWPPG